MATFAGSYELMLCVVVRVYVWCVDCVDSLIADVRVWKECLVAEEGIGADCAPSLYAFDELGGLLGFVMLQARVVDRVDQFGRCVGAMRLLREGWGAFGVGVVLEGYLTTRVEGLPVGGPGFAERFAAGDGSVVETISVVWRDAGGGSRVFSMPYRLGVGRRVVWLDELAQDVSVDVAGGYPFALGEVFRVGVVERFSEVLPEARFLAVAGGLADLGFVVVSGLLDPLWGGGLF
jgi:hypothetical protein